MIDVLTEIYEPAAAPLPLPQSPLLRLRKRLQALLPEALGEKLAEAISRGAAKTRRSNSQTDAQNRVPLEPSQNASPPTPESRQTLYRQVSQALAALETARAVPSPAGQAQALHAQPWHSGASSSAQAWHSGASPSAQALGPLIAGQNPPYAAPAAAPPLEPSARMDWLQSPEQPLKLQALDRCFERDSRRYDGGEAPWS